MQNTIVFLSMLVILTLSVTVLPIGIFVISRKNVYEPSLSPVQKKECTLRTQGVITTITKKRISITTPFNLGFTKPSIAFVTKYKVQGKTYKIKEEVELVTKQLPLGFIQKTPFHLRSWKKVTVCYNPQSPQEAYVLENVGEQ